MPLKVESTVYHNHKNWENLGDTAPGEGGVLTDRKGGETYYYVFECDASDEFSRIYRTNRAFNNRNDRRILNYDKDELVTELRKGQSLTIRVRTEADLEKSNVRFTHY